MDLIDSSLLVEARDLYATKLQSMRAIYEKEIALRDEEIRDLRGQMNVMTLHFLAALKSTNERRVTIENHNHIDEGAVQLEISEGAVKVSTPVSVQPPMVDARTSVTNIPPSGDLEIAASDGRKITVRRS